jgi:hypothetical protein
MCVDCSASQVQNGREHLLRLPLGRLAWSTTPNLPQSDDRRKGALSAAKGRFGTNISGLIWQIMHLTDIISTVYKIYPMEQQTQEPGAGLEGLRETRTFRPQAPINGRIHLKDTKGDQPVSTHSVTRARKGLWPRLELLLHHDKFCRAVSAHSVNRTRKAGTNGVLVAARSLGNNSYGLVRPTYDVVGRER